MNDLKELRARAESQALNALKRYVANRQRAFEMAHRMDPTSQLAKDAERFLEKANDDYAAFACAIGRPVDIEGSVHRAPVSTSGPPPAPAAILVETVEAAQPARLADAEQPVLSSMAEALLLQQSIRPTEEGLQEDAAADEATEGSLDRVETRDVASGAQATQGGGDLIATGVQTETRQRLFGRSRDVEVGQDAATIVAPLPKLEWSNDVSTANPAPLGPDTGSSDTIGTRNARHGPGGGDEFILAVMQTASELSAEREVEDQRIRLAQDVVEADAASNMSSSSALKDGPGPAFDPEPRSPVDAKADSPRLAHPLFNDPWFDTFASWTKRSK